MSIEVVFLQEEKIGICGKAVVEHIVSFGNEIDAERFLFKLRENGYNPYVRRFDLHQNIKDVDFFVGTMLAKQSGFIAMGEILEKE